jgi:opacity protein-like surface antigen
MKNHTREILCAALSCAALLSPARARAQAQGGDVSLGGRGMYFKPDDGTGVWSGGAQLRLHLTSVWAVEGSVDYRRETFDGGDTRVYNYPVQASLLAYLMPGSPISPFLLAGGGWYYTRTDGPNGYEQTQDRFGPHVGAGVEAYLNSSWSIDGTYRYIWVKDVESRNASLLDANYSDSGHMVTAGLNYHF